MRLYGKYEIVVTDNLSGRVVFAGVYDTWWQRNRALVQSVQPLYPGDRYFIQIGILPESLPSFAGHPKENVLRVAEEQHIDPQLLLRVQELENLRIRDFGARLKFLLAKFGPLLIAGVLTLAASALFYEAGPQPLFYEERAHYGVMSGRFVAMALASWLGSLWCLYLYERDWTFVAFFGFLLFLGAVFGNELVGPALSDLVRGYMFSNQP